MQKMGPEEEPGAARATPSPAQELFQYHRVLPSAPSLAPVHPDHLPGLLSLQGKQGEPCGQQSTTGETAAGFGECLWVRKGSGRKSQTWHEPQSRRPSRSFLEFSSPPTLEQCSWSNTGGFLTTVSSSISTTLLSQCQNSSCKWPAEQTQSTAIRQGRSLLPPARHRQGLPRASPRSAANTSRTSSPAGPGVSLADVELSGCWALPVAPLGQALSVPGGVQREPARVQGPGNACDGRSRFLSSQQGRWAGRGGGSILISPSCTPNPDRADSEPCPG